MKKLLLGLFISLMCLGSISCSRINEVLDDHLNYSKVNIKYDSKYYAEYKDLKIIFDEKEYNAVGSYKVPKNTIIDISWNWRSGYGGDWEYSSESVSIGAYENTNITIKADKLIIEN